MAWYLALYNIWCSVFDFLCSAYKYILVLIISILILQALTLGLEQMMACIWDQGVKSHRTWAIGHHIFFLNDKAKSSFQAITRRGFGLCLLMFEFQAKMLDLPLHCLSPFCEDHFVNNVVVAGGHFEIQCQETARWFKIRCIKRSRLVELNGNTFMF